MPYKNFFGLNYAPFKRNQTVEQLFKTDNQSETIARLKYIVNAKEFAVLTGDPGTGKSTTLRMLAAELNNKRFKVIYISDAKLTQRNFYTEALLQLGGTPRFYRGDLRRQLHQAIEHLMDNSGMYPVIIIDEAHLFEREMYEELRFLLNFNMDSYAPVSLIISGQNELKKLLKLQAYEAIVQRINLRCSLIPFNKAETNKYIHHQTTAAGAPNQIFTDSATSLIYDYTIGTARKINNVCCISMLQAFNAKQKLIDAELVAHVIETEMAF